MEIENRRLHPSPVSSQLVTTTHRQCRRDAGGGKLAGGRAVGGNFGGPPLNCPPEELALSRHPLILREALLDAETKTPENLNGSERLLPHFHLLERQSAHLEQILNEVDQKPPLCWTASCKGCSLPIKDRILLSLGASLTWHTQCLKCTACSLPMDSFNSCFVKEEVVYCKNCYLQEFSTRCAACRRSISASDWVRRARSHVYHIACFACQHCKRQLSTGEEFALQDENRLLCKQHYMELVEGDTGQSKAKTKRVRTTFSEEQLAVLQAHFQVDSNPDGADLERIANVTGLSKRVTQVWFQNSRARQKKYQGTKKGGGGEGGTISFSSGDETTHSPRSAGSSEDGMIFPTSVTTSAEEAAISSAPVASLSLQPINYN